MAGEAIRQRLKVLRNLDHADLRSAAQGADECSKLALFLQHELLQLLELGGEVAVPRAFHGFKPEARAGVRQALRYWQRDPAFAGVREQAALAKLPEAERDAWQRFWADVEALLGQAR